MKTSIVKLGIGFADSEYKSFQMLENNVLIINMSSWEERPFGIVFSNVIQFLYRLGDVPKDLYEISNNSPFLEEAVLQEYGYMPLDHPFKLFHLVDISGFPFIQIVAESVEAFVEDDRKKEIS